MHPRSLPIAALLAGALALTACANGNDTADDTAADGAATTMEGATTTPDAAATDATGTEAAADGAAPAQ